MMYLLSAIVLCAIVLSAGARLRHHDTVEFGCLCGETLDK